MIHKIWNLVWDITGSVFIIVIAIGLISHAIVFIVRDLKDTWHGR